MGPSSPGGAQIVYRDNPQPTREDPAIEQARLNALRTQQQQRGRGATMIVKRPTETSDLLPTVTGGGAALLGAG